MIVSRETGPSKDWLNPDPSLEKSGVEYDPQEKLDVDVAFNKKKSV